MLEFYDSDKNPFSSDSLRFKHDGHLGGTEDKLIYVKNNDLTLYYTSITIGPVSENTNNILGEWGETGFGLKLLYGQAQPTETEWDQVKNGESINIPDIGTTSAADNVNFYPIWVRNICPTMQSAQLKSDISLAIGYSPKQLGT